MSVYTGSNNGFMQAAYVDQQGTALPGDLAYASDVDLIDACVVSMPAGSEGDLLPVGVGVVGAYSADASRPGMTSVKVSPVGADTTAAQLYGVTVRNQQCRTDGNNVSGWGDGDVCNVMRTARVGGRIWVTAGNAATANTAAHLVVKDTTSHGLPVGSFVGTEITGDTVALTNVQWVTAASAGSLGLLGDQLADLLGGLSLGAFEAGEVGLKSGGRHQGNALGIVDHLSNHVTVGAGDHQARTLGGTGDALADTRVTALESYLLAFSENSNAHITYQPFQPCAGCVHRST